MISPPLKRDYFVTSILLGGLLFIMGMFVYGLLVGNLGDAFASPLYAWVVLEMLAAEERKRYQEQRVEVVK